MAWDAVEGKIDEMQKEGCMHACALRIEDVRMQAACSRMLAPAGSCLQGCAAPW